MRDPVCGMSVGPGALMVEGRPDLGFCSEHCRTAYLADPQAFDGGGDAAHRDHGDGA